jgi:RNA polymerase sigma-70 factor, ECF subfamily
VACSEAELVAGLRRGEAAAFDEAYARWRDRIFGFLWRLAGRRELAEDLFQETWLKLARHATSLREDTELGAWLYTVARNQYRSHRRWHVLDADRLRQFAAEPPSVAIGPDEKAQARGALASLDAALASLPAASREVLLLIAVEGLAQEQVARILGLEYDAVRQRLSRARAQLAERMEREPERGSERMKAGGRS